MVGVEDASLQYRWIHGTSHLASSMGRQLQHSLDEPRELSQLLCHDNIVINIIPGFSINIGTLLVIVCYYYYYRYHINAYIFLILLL